MSSNKSTNGTAARLSLPPLHTLNLLPASRSTSSNVKYEHYDNLRSYPYTLNNLHHGRNTSTSSSCTTTSRQISPSPSSDTESDASSSPDSSTNTKFRLVPCALEDADAVIFVPPEDATSASNTTNYVARQGAGKGLLLVGPALQQIRHPQRPLAKGARLHPYRIVRGPRSNTKKANHGKVHQRCSSIISVTGFTL